MSQRSDSDSEDVLCSRFEPQPWRKNRCRFCFRLKSEHSPSQRGDDDDDGSSAAIRPEVDKNTSRRQASRMKRKPGNENLVRNVDSYLETDDQSISTSSSSVGHVTGESVDNDRVGRSSAQSNGAGNNAEFGAAGVSNVQSDAAGIRDGKRGVTRFNDGVVADETVSETNETVEVSRGRNANVASAGYRLRKNDNNSVEERKQGQKSENISHSSLGVESDRSVGDGCTDKTSIDNTDSVNRRHSLATTVIGRNVDSTDTERTDNTQRRRHSLESGAEDVSSSTTGIVTKNKVAIPAAFQQQTTGKKSTYSSYQEKTDRNKSNFAKSSNERHKTPSSVTMRNLPDNSSLRSSAASSAGKRAAATESSSVYSGNEERETVNKQQATDATRGASCSTTRDTRRMVKSGKHTQDASSRIPTASGHRTASDAVKKRLTDDARLDEARDGATSMDYGTDDIGVDLRRPIVFESSNFKTSEDGETRLIAMAKSETRLRERETRRERVGSNSSDSESVTSSRAPEVDMTYVEELEDDLFELEDRCDNLEKENKDVRKQLTDLETKCEDLDKRLQNWKVRYDSVEERRLALEDDNRRLQERVRTPSVVDDDFDNDNMSSDDLKQRYYEAEQICEILRDENDELKIEMEELRLEMEEMHDNFRDEEDAMAFRELQKELEATAKNCRILQFKLRKSERRNNQVEAERNEFEDRVRKLETKFDATDEQFQMRELEEDLKMAKEVSVRLHDELEFVEEKRAKFEEENEKLKEKLKVSETERKTLESQIERIKNEMERLRADLIEQGAKCLDEKSFNIPPSPEALLQQGTDRLSPIRPPMLSASSRQSSTEHDVAQLMRDLSDCRERELDLKDQLKFAEEEINVCRKKLSELEDENESLVLSLRKISKHKKAHLSASSDEESFSETDDRDAKLQIELTEQEMNVVKRKLEEMEKQNETLTKEVSALHRKLTEKYKEINEMLDTDPGDGLAYRASLLNDEIETLKWKLIEKDGEIARLVKLAQKAKTPQAKLKKSRSLDSDSSVDIKRQLDLVTQEAQILKDKLTYLEDENEKLISDNNKLLLIARRRVPSLTKDDPAVENVILRDKIDLLEVKNCKLRQHIRDLEDKLGDAAVELTREERETDLGKTKEKLCVAEEEIKILKKKLMHLEDDHIRLLDSVKKKRERAKSNLSSLSSHELRDEIEELDDEITEMKQILKVKDENNTKLEDDMSKQQEEFDKVKQQLLNKEKQLLDEFEMMENKNVILSNLLEVVTARIESEPSSLSATSSSSSSAAKRSSRTLNSLGSNNSTESDDVFVQTPGQKVTTRFDWEKKFRLRIECLEKLLEEERSKAQAQSVTLPPSNIPAAAGSSAVSEKALLQSELTVCKGQLEEANKNVMELNNRLSRVQTTHESIKENFDTVAKELEEERVKRKQLGKMQVSDESLLMKEKEELERSLDNYKHKTETLYSELERLQKNLPCEKYSEESEEKSKEQLKKDIQEYQEACIKHSLRHEELQYRLNESAEMLKYKEEEFDKERSKFTMEKNSLLEQIKSRDESMSRTNDLLQQKETLIHQKDQTICANNDTISQKDVLLKQKEDSIRKLEVSTKQRDNEVTKLRDQLSQKEATLLQQESKIRQMDDHLRQRDDRLREKDEIVRTLNTKIREQEGKLNEMDRRTMSFKDKLKTRESEIRKMEGVAKERAFELQEATRQKNSLQKKLESATTEREKIGNEMGSIRQQKISLENDKRALQVEIQQYKDRLHIRELSRSSYESKVVKTLLEEKDKLFTEKHRLQAELDTMRVNGGGMNREKYEKLLKDRSKQLDDSMELNDKLQIEINILTTKFRDTTTALSDVEISEQQLKETLRSKCDQHEEEKDGLLQKIVRDDKVFEIEASALRANYENKLSSLQTEIIRLKSQTCHLRTDCQTKAAVVDDLERQVELQRRKQETESDLWEKERKDLESKLREVDERRRKVSELLKVVEEGKMKLCDSESARVELQNKYTTDKSSWEIQRLELQSRINQLEEINKCHNRDKEKPQSRFKDLKARLYTHARLEHVSEKDKAEMKKALSEAHNLSIELQDQIRLAESRRTNEKRDLMTQHSQTQVEWERDREQLCSKIAKLEARCQQYQSVAARLQHLERDTRHERDAWIQERSELSNGLQETRALLALEKRKLDNIVMELQKLRELSPLVEHSVDKGSNLKQQPSVPQTNVEVRQALDERFVSHLKTALAQLMKLSEDITHGRRVAPSVSISTHDGNQKGSDCDLRESDLDLSTSPFYAILSTLSRQYTSLHSDGTQSAHVSRSATPDRPGRRGISQSPVRKITNYPVPPPSFLITTPKRSQSPASTGYADSDDGGDSISGSTSGVFYHSLPASRRLPALKKCYSLDTPAAEKLWSSKDNTPHMSRAGSTENGYFETERKYARAKAWAETTGRSAANGVVDAAYGPGSHNSLASISEYDQSSLSRKVARQKFYAGYERSNPRDSGFSSWPERKNQIERTPGAGSEEASIGDATSTELAIGSEKDTAGDKLPTERSSRKESKVKEKEDRVKEEKARKEAAKVEKLKEEAAKEEKLKKEKDEKKAKEELAKKEKEAKKAAEKQQKVSKLAKYAPFVFSVKERSQMWQQKSSTSQQKPAPSSSKPTPSTSASSKPTPSTSSSSGPKTITTPSVLKPEKPEKRLPFGFLRKSASVDMTPKPSTAMTSQIKPSTSNQSIPSKTKRSKTPDPGTTITTKAITEPVTIPGSGKTWRVTPV